MVGFPPSDSSSIGSGGWKPGGSERAAPGLQSSFPSWLTVSSLSHPGASGGFTRRGHRAFPWDPGGLSTASFCYQNQTQTPTYTGGHTAMGAGREVLLFHGHCFCQDLPIAWGLRIGRGFGVFL